MVAGKLSHLIDPSSVSELKGNAQHLVRLDASLEGYISQCSIDFVLRAVQQACRSQFLIVDTSREADNTVEHRRCLVDVTGIRIGGYHTAVLTVGIIAGNGGHRTS